MNPLRILLISPERRAADVVTQRLCPDACQLFHVEHFSEALEAVSFQKFNMVLVCTPVDATQLSEFVSDLRNSELAQKAGEPIPVILSSPAITNGTLAGDAINGLIPEAFTIAELQQASKRVVAPGPATSAAVPTSSEANELPVFLEEKYAEQLGEDPSLMAEIIEIFFSEYAGQAEELAQAFKHGDFEQVSRLAHTVKGSLSSLQGPRSRACAQELETLAKTHDASVIEPAWRAMEAEIEVLRPCLVELHERLSRT